MEITLAALQGRWTTLVIRELLRGDHSYSDLRAALAAPSDKVTKVAADVITRWSSARARASQPVTARSRRTALASPPPSRTRAPPGTAGDRLTSPRPRRVRARPRRH
ncbi:hypothetical protein GTY87_27250 [Streptomyces sp. SID7813]|uniref:Transcriptional regulator n=1 Tax=Streptomyces coelicolor (strain ATCC BAA-471 / A3(2) / M145) TaxID=100226 RepID=Q9XAG6_STRCO|nr:hypothetical protein [Streptomyces sp. SID7813]QFI45208.1 hypothetical protein FQ762_27505 [Streptomyces coelicolor A3(2)]CAB45599.1 hypothetical protein [Streptomyces coelicolor A3(2)]